MGEEFVHELRTQLREINASLKERCPQRLKLIDENTKDIDSAFSRIRALENKVTKLTLLSSIGTLLLTAALVKFFVG